MTSATDRREALGYCAKMTLVAVQSRKKDSVPGPRQGRLAVKRLSGMLNELTRKAAGQPVVARLAERVSDLKINTVEVSRQAAVFPQSRRNVGHPDSKCRVIVQRRCTSCGSPVENIPLQAERHSARRQKLFAFLAESAFIFRPECCSESQRNRVHLRPDSPS